MAVVRLEEVNLYLAADKAGSTDNLEANAYMDHSNVPYTKLLYVDESQHQLVLDAVNTWWANREEHTLPPVTTFPFLTYTEVRDDMPVRLSPVKYLEGLEAIKTFGDMYNQYK